MVKADRFQEHLGSLVGKLEKADNLYSRKYFRRLIIGLKEDYVKGLI